MEGRFLGFQYLAGGMSEIEGRRALGLMTEGAEVIDMIMAWIERYPVEQRGYIEGWQNYYDSYRKVFHEMETQLRNKLNGE